MTQAQHFSHLHHKLVMRLELEGRLETLTGLHIGATAHSSFTDHGILRDGYGRALLPGTSLKGALRAHVERFCDQLGAWTCYLSQSRDQNQNDDSSAKICLSSQKGGPAKIQEAARKYAKDDQSLSQFLEDNLCDICRLFGGASYRSKLAFADATILPDYQFPPEHRDGVGINRVTGIAQAAIKFDFETLSAGSCFGIKIRAENLNSREEAIFALGMLELLEGHIPLGGKTSRGLGQCRLHEEDLRLRCTDFRQPEQIRDFFKAGPALIEPRSYFKRCLNLALNGGN